MSGKSSPSSSATPLHVGAPVRQGDITLTPEIFDYDGTSHVRVQNSAGVEIIIPTDFLPALSARSSTVYTGVANLVDERRRAFLGDLAEFGLEKRRSDGSLWTLPEDTDTKADGTPVIRWVRPKDNSADASGWALYLAGADDAVISTARWNDRDALAALVESMRDRELLITMAGIAHSEAIAKLSARMQASTLRGARSLPAIDTKRVRDILVAAGLGRDGIAATTGVNMNRWSAPQARVLNITSLGRKVPVAVAVASPNAPIRELTEAERQLPWKQRHEVELDLRKQAAQPWLEKAKASMVAAGWRVIDLPRTRRSYYSDTEIFWVTRIDAETWTSVAAAAQEAADGFSMSRSTTF